MPKVSVLVAVYNAEQWLPQSLGSLLSQTMQDIQVICVDDCSTDGSLTILNDYARSDPRFKVIHLEENQGQAHARNVALQRLSWHRANIFSSSMPMTGWRPMRYN